MRNQKRPHPMKGKKRAPRRPDRKILPDPAGGLLTRAQVASLLGVQVQSIAAREARGKPLLPKIKISGVAVRYRRSDFDKMLAERTVGIPQSA